jgi:transposase
MSQLTTKKYPPELKERAVKLAVESEQSIAQTARDLGVNENTLPSGRSSRSKMNTCTRN